MEVNIENPVPNGYLLFENKLDVLFAIINDNLCSREMENYFFLVC